MVTELYVRDSEDSQYQSSYIDEHDIINVIKQKIRMILFTNKGDVYGAPLFGVGLDSYVFDFDHGYNSLIAEIEEQIEDHIGEDSREYDIKVDFAYIPDQKLVEIYIYINNKLELRYQLN